LPIVEVGREPIEGAEAYFEASLSSGRTFKIAVSVRAHHPGWSLIHEIGRLLDFAALGHGMGYCSVIHPLFGAWREAITGSAAYQRLEFLRDEESHPLALRALAAFMGSIMNSGHALTRSSWRSEAVMTT
jgi:hypothetical protein